MNKHRKPRLWTPASVLILVIVAGLVLLGAYFGLREWERYRQREHVRQILEHGLSP